MICFSSLEQVQYSPCSFSHFSSQACGDAIWMGFLQVLQTLRPGFLRYLRFDFSACPFSWGTPQTSLDPGWQLKSSPKPFTLLLYIWYFRYIYFKLLPLTFNSKVTQFKRTGLNCSTRSESICFKIGPPGFGLTWLPFDLSSWWYCARSFLLSFLV